MPKLKNEPFYLGEYNYTAGQVRRARDIRSLPDDNEHKLFRIRCFEIENEKKFPESEPILLTLNTDTAFSDWHRVQDGITGCIMNTRASRAHIIL